MDTQPCYSSWVPSNKFQVCEFTGDVSKWEKNIDQNLFRAPKEVLLWLMDVGLKKGCDPSTPAFDQVKSEKGQLNSLDIFLMHPGA